MDSSDTAYDNERYRQLLAEATTEQKRLALIDVLIREKARDRLAEQLLQAKLSGLGLKAETPMKQTAFASLQHSFQYKPHQPNHVSESR
jgi:hypothetical protein